LEYRKVIVVYQLSHTIGLKKLAPLFHSIRVKPKPIADIAVESAVKHSFVLNGMQTRRKGQYNAELTLAPRLYVKPLITAITAL